MKVIENWNDKYSVILNENISVDRSIISVEFEVSQVDISSDYILSGFIKWDGCMNMKSNGYIHTCCLQDIKMYNELLEIIYKKAFEMMGTNADKELFGL